MADEIKQDIDPNAPKAIAQFVCTLYLHPNGVTSTNMAWDGPGFDEVNSRFMLDKARSEMDAYWQQQNKPKVMPSNGAPLTQQVRRLIG